MPLIYNLQDPRPHGSCSCIDCPAIYERPAGYYEGMDLATCPKVKSCPCGFNPLLYWGCIHERREKEIPAIIDLYGPHRYTRSTTDGRTS